MCAAKFNDFLKEYTDPITGEQKYMEQLVRTSTKSWNWKQPYSCAGASVGKHTAGAQAEIANRKRKVLEVEIDDVESVRAQSRMHQLSQQPYWLLTLAPGMLAARLPHHAADPTSARASHHVIACLCWQ